MTFPVARSEVVRPVASQRLHPSFTDFIRSFHERHPVEGLEKIRDSRSMGRTKTKQAMKVSSFCHAQQDTWYLTFQENSSRVEGRIVLGTGGVGRESNFWNSKESRVPPHRVTLTAISRGDDKNPSTIEIRLE
uniref:Uncharacterized protein n=1 Tax=Compsopogon caeruleus TaxID=31354 RepID=A0A7S1TF28_9RHOD|mmetsp:Transcript_4346/g.8573  ORF Transcript_4346/g.8573 Transcript_4346/m.8573 type:complete len:133 (+) Transcript_4346:596-994(+)